MRIDVSMQHSLWINIFTKKIEWEEDPDLAAGFCLKINFSFDSAGHILRSISLD